MPRMNSMYLPEKPHSYRQAFALKVGLLNWALHFALKSECKMLDSDGVLTKRQIANIAAGVPDLEGEAIEDRIAALLRVGWLQLTAEDPEGDHVFLVPMYLEENESSTERADRRRRDRERKTSRKPS